MSNLKCIALTVSELFAFNAQKFRGHVTLATPFSKKFKGLCPGVRTVTGNMRAKFEVRSFNRFKLVHCAHTETDRHAHVERTHISAIHFVRSLGGDKNKLCLCGCLFLSQDKIKVSYALAGVDIILI